MAEDRALQSTNKKVLTHLGTHQAGEADTKLPCKGFLRLHQRDEGDASLPLPSEAQ